MAQGAGHPHSASAAWPQRVQHSAPVRSVPAGGHRLDRRLPRSVELSQPAAALGRTKQQQRLAQSDLRSAGNGGGPPARRQPLALEALSSGAGPCHAAGRGHSAGKSVRRNFVAAQHPWPQLEREPDSGAKLDQGHGVGGPPVSAPRPRLTSSLRWRLSTAICGAILLCTMLFVAASVIFLQQQLTNNATSDLRTTLNTVPQYLRAEDAELRGLALLVAGDPVVPRDVQTDNAQHLGVHLIHSFATLNVDILDVVDPHGRVLVREEDPIKRHDNVAWMPTIRDALYSGKNGFALETDQRGKFVDSLKGKGTVDTETIRGADISRRYVPPAVATYALRSTIPLRLNGKILGAIVVGRLLDNAFAQGISHALANSVNLIVAGQRTGCSLTDENGLPVTGLPESSAILKRIAINKSSITQTSENGNSVLSGLVPLPGNNGKPAGAIELVSQLNPLYSLITRLSFLLVSLGALVVIVGTLFALDISRRLTSRLQILESTASHVAQMANFDAPLTDMREVVAVRGGDEVASLARSFSAMMAALDARMEANAQLYSAARARVRELTGLAEIARLL